MNLQGRNLSIEMQGDDVKLLHSELQETCFGESTHEAVMKFQRCR